MSVGISQSRHWICVMGHLRKKKILQNMVSGGGRSQSMLGVKVFSQVKLTAVRDRRWCMTG